MTAKEVRKIFLEFFSEKEHKIVSSAPMVVKNDPTLMFINAGMNQFKDIFLGNDTAKDSRVANTQKCLRVSGKHNDLEEVGVDTYHHTMFEMLGNWSFGDYFKKEAIYWAWELLIDRYKIDKNRLYVTIFEGDKKDGVDWDEEAYGLWTQLISEDRIIKAGKKDNFWEMGDIGPCGPSSEIHIDLRSDEERRKVDGKELVNEDHPQVIEIWNLVFIEYNRRSDQSLELLKEKHVDTGMGFERLCMALQGKKSNYDTDIFMPLIKRITEITGVAYKSSDTKTDIAIRVIADHIRAVSFSISDGQLPSNNGAGYVIRRILRRAIRYGFSFLNKKEAFIYKLINILVEEMGDQFPELAKQKELIEKVVKEEELNFLRTLEKGMQKMEEWTSKEIDGNFAFELYDTFGFPIDLTQLIANEKGWSVDMDAFEKCLVDQKNRSKKAAKIETGDWVVLKDDDVEEFVGYDMLETDVYITKYRKVVTKNKELYQLVFNITPFYAEGGGQIGDTGFIDSEGDRVFIVDTKKENNLIIHFTETLPTHPDRKFKAVVNGEKQALTAKNHSATHLLHYALRKVLGDHVEQKGSLVNEEYLRFDFAHFQKVDAEQLLAIEEMVNDQVRMGFDLQEERAIPIASAKEMGAMALFGEKYGDLVRVIQFDKSVELCGGIHVKNTARIGAFKIISESAVAAGVRRIEAITSVKADAFLRGQLLLLDEVRSLLKDPKDVKIAVSQLINQNAQLNKEIEELKRQKAQQLKGKLIDQIQEFKGAQFLAVKVDLDPSSIKDLAFQLKAKYDNLLFVAGTVSKGKPNLSVMVSEKLVNERDLNAGNIIRELAKEIDGGGGGQAFFATAGGKNVNGLDKAIEKAKEFL